MILHRAKHGMFSLNGINVRFLIFCRIYATLVSENKPSHNLVETAEEGFEKVKTGRYAFMWDDAILQWIQTIHCEYMSVGKPFMNKVGRRKFRRQKFRRQKFRRKKFRRISKSRNFVVRKFVVGNFVVRKFVVGNFVVLIRITAFTKRYLNYTIT